ncbi:MAG: hypothetical protein MK129_03430 [SAR116 cluster bacterium]|nr:hypothetical protein [SAR116 cluster bacterium]
MSTDHYLLLFDLALFALAVVFLGKLMSQWIAQWRTSKRMRAFALGAMVAAGWLYIIYRYGAVL